MDSVNLHLRNNLSPTAIEAKFKITLEQFKTKVVEEFNAFFGGQQNFYEFFN